METVMMNLNQIKKYLKDWFSKSPFVNTVIVSNKDDFASIRDVNYPVCHIEYLNNSINSNYNNYNFIISIADIQNNKLDNRNVDDIHNDTMLIAQDFIDFHYDEIEKFEMDENIHINPFDDENPDRTAGITFAIRLSVFREKDKCILPKIKPSDAFDIVLEQ
ncbi:hypothetical protein [Sphingobacterium sp. 1.A.5]|uniref:hypothetical protein n=1 Tax=Sphingobacterium sp. 1.A.5 TaxID=2044604 RepID=UPI000C0BC790|nr:hypothetical protein [Sphingobacterium sp. 1.A.5]